MNFPVISRRLPEPIATDVVAHSPTRPWSARQRRKTVMDKMRWQRDFGDALQITACFASRRIVVSAEFLKE